MAERDTLYTPAEIATFLKQDALALNGVSPEVGQQNKRVIDHLGELSCQLNIEPISIQLLGSRAHGTATLSSDVDFAFLALGDERYPDISAAAESLAQKTGLNYDPSMARICLGITSRVPDTLDWLSFWAESTAPFSLFNPGINRTSNTTATLLQAATTTLQMQGAPEQRRQLWEGMRTEYNRAYLGTQTRILEKLGERLGPNQSTALADLISKKFMGERYKAFGLYPTIEAAHAALTRKVAAIHPQKLSPASTRALDLYSDTQRLIAA